MNLVNEELEVEVAELEAYQGTRFDRTGLITQVRLKQGNHSYCVAEHPGSTAFVGGSGICNEFGIFKAIGYEEASIGSSFPKLGLGLLRRLDEADYDFQRKYPLVPFHTEITVKKNSIQFVVHPMNCRGFAAKLVKTISIDHAELQIEYSLQNVGDQILETNEYTHNFIGINNHCIGSDYKLAFSFPIKSDPEAMIDPSKVLHIADREVRWKARPNKAFYCKLKGYEATKTVQWELVHLPSGVGMREICSFPVSMIALWGEPHVVSPEVFIAIHLKPGETQTWKRIYQFFCKP